MARGITPFIGLAVVMALALAAVFGSMSLANPAFAQAAPTNVMAAVTTADHDSDDATPEEPVTQSITLTWDDQDDAAQANWQVQWRFASVAGGWGTWRATGEGGVVITDADAEDGDNVSAVISGAGSGLNNGTEYCFRVRYRDGDLPGLASDEDCAVPNVRPDGTIAAMNAAKSETEDGEIMGGKITLTWTYDNAGGTNTAAEVTGWEYRARISDTDAVTADAQPQAWNRVDWMELEGVEETDVTNGQMATVYAPRDDVSYDYQVRPVAGDLKYDDSTLDTHTSSEVTTAAATADPRPVIIPTVDPSFTAGSTSSHSNTSYKVQFQIWGEDDEGYRDLNTLRDELVIEFHEDYSLPSSISTSAVTIDVEGADASGDPDAKTMLTFNPSDIVVDGEEAVFSLGDMNEDDDLSQYDLMPEAAITVNFRQAAGIRNPTEAGNYNIVKIGFGDFEIDNGNEEVAGLNIEDAVRRKISLSEEDGGLGDMVTATAKGFENGVTLHFFLDKHLDANGKYVGPDGQLSGDEDVLCSVPSVSGSNVASCDFEVTTPTFSTGDNFVNAVDGDGNPPYDPDNDDHKFVLKASFSASPAGGSPGEIMQVQLVSFPSGMAFEHIKLSGDYICGGAHPVTGEHQSCATYGTIGTMGTASIAITVPNWAVPGVQELRIKAGGETDTGNVTIVGPRIISTPATVVANQRVSLVGTGFSPNSVIGDDTAAGAAVSKMSIGGHPIPWHKVNDGRDVNVDDGGNWAASVDLPLVEATTGSGERAIRVTDSKTRGGVVMVTLAERSFDITPPEGRVGTLAVVRGVGYPSKNDEGHSFTIDVIYKVQEGATSRVSVVPDASGRFEVQLRIPTTASIPSTNQVEVSFDHEAGATGVLENKQHFVPEGLIMLSATSGGPGSTVTLSGEGFKTYVPVESVKIGTIEITPSPKPNTDANGMMEFDVLIPGLDVGIQTVEVKVGGTTSSTGFTVTESGVNPGDIKEVAVGLEELGDNLDVIWHFNNDSKEWTFYDGQEGSTLTHVITGETYLILIKSDAEVILNGDTRSLTCVSGNCWNQIVW